MLFKFNIQNVLLISLLFFQILLNWGCRSHDKPAEESIKKLAAMKLQESPVTVSSAYPARIEGKVNVDIRAQAEGYLEKIFIEEGAFVKAGQPLFKINDLPLKEQLNTAKANLSAAQAAVKNAKLEVEKFTTLSNNKITSGFQLKTANAALESAEANVAQQTALVEAAKINLGFTTVKAPVSGFIGRIPKRTGNLISRTDTEPLTTLTDISQIYAYFSMTELDFLQFNSQQSGNKTLPQLIADLPQVSLILADGTPYEKKGRIQMIDGQFDTAIGAISIRAAFDNPKYILRSGNTGRIVLPETISNAILLPVRATMDMQDKIFAFRLKKDQTVERVSIITNGKSGDNYIVKGGIKAGDVVIIHDVATIQEGEKIQPDMTTVKK